MKIFRAFIRIISSVTIILKNGTDGFSLRTEKFDAHYTSKWYNYSVINEIPISQSNITFQVKACKEARIILAENCETLRPSYEVIIDKASRYSRILSCGAYPCANDRYTDNRTVNGILSCQSFRSFWISWNGELKFGLGTDIGVHVVLSERRLPNINIKYIGLVTITGKSDEWILNEHTLSFNISVNNCQLPVSEITYLPTDQSQATTDYASHLSTDRSTATTEDAGYLSTDKSTSTTENVGNLSTDRSTATTEYVGYLSTDKSTSTTENIGNLSTDKSTATTEGVGYLSTDKSRATTEDVEYLSTDKSTLTTEGVGYLSTDRSTSTTEDVEDLSTDKSTAITKDAGYLSTDKLTATTEDVGYLSTDKLSATTKDVGYLSTDKSISTTEDVGYLSADKSTSTTDDVEYLSTEQSTSIMEGASHLSTDHSTVAKHDASQLSTGRSIVATEDASRLLTVLSSATTYRATYQPSDHSSVGNTLSIITTSVPTAQQTNLQCQCPCRSSQQNPWSYIYSMNLTLEEIRAELKQELVLLKNRIQIDRKMTKRYNSTKTSATDNRFSSRVTGWIGGIVLLIIVGILISFDLTTIFA